MFPGGGGEFVVKFVGEEFEVSKRRRYYHGCGGKKGKGEAILRLLGRI